MGEIRLHLFMCLAQKEISPAKTAHGLCSVRNVFLTAFFRILKGLKQTSSHLQTCVLIEADRPSLVPVRCPEKDTTWSHHPHTLRKKERIKKEIQKEWLSLSPGDFFFLREYYTWRKHVAQSCASQVLFHASQTLVTPLVTTDFNGKLQNRRVRERTTLPVG